MCTVQYTEPDLVAALNCGFIFYNSWDSSLDPMLRRSGAPLVFTEYYLQVRPPSGQTIQDFLFLHPSTGLPTEPGESAEEHKEGCDRNPSPDREPLLQQVSVSVSQCVEDDLTALLQVRCSDTGRLRAEEIWEEKCSHVQ